VFALFFAAAVYLNDRHDLGSAEEGEFLMKIIDFRFRPNTAAVLTGTQNSKMFKGLW